MRHVDHRPVLLNCHDLDGDRDSLSGEDGRVQDLRVLDRERKVHVSNGTPSWPWQQGPCLGHPPPSCLLCSFQAICAGDGGKPSHTPRLGRAGPKAARPLRGSCLPALPLPLPSLPPHRPADASHVPAMRVLHNIFQSSWGRGCLISRVYRHGEGIFVSG